MHNLRDYALGKHRQVDDYQFGGGAGMVMRPEPLAACIEKLTAERSYDAIIYTSPDGKRLDQSLCNQLSMKENLLVICGHYKGIDERIREKYVTLDFFRVDIAAKIWNNSFLYQLIPPFTAPE